MDYRCPYCSSPLKWKLISTEATSGQRRFFPGSAYQACPSCGGRLRYNTHPLEKRLDRWYWPLLIMLLALSPLIVQLHPLLVVLPLGLFAVMAYAVVRHFYVVWHQLKSWPRYKQFP
jgi:DNA-directed RNA polymerase subunit RPC12/RpoP